MVEHVAISRLRPTDLPTDKLAGGDGKETVCVGLEFALKRWHPGENRK
jgi:hypothetical protein